MEETVKDRLIKFIKHSGLSKNRFEEICGLSKRYVSNISKSIQPDKLKKISNHFPELNTGWLMTGEGEMIRDDKKSTSDFGAESHEAEPVKEQVVERKPVTLDRKSYLKLLVVGVFLIIAIWCKVSDILHPAPAVNIGEAVNELGNSFIEQTGIDQMNYLLQQMNERQKARTVDSLSVDSLKVDSLKVK